MRRSLTVMFGMAALFGIGALRPAEARPLYGTCYKEVFKKEIEDSKYQKFNCFLCHDEGSDRKNRNDYGKKLAEELGEKNVRDREKIKAALEKIGPHPMHQKEKPKPKPDPPPPGPGPDPTPGVSANDGQCL